jgi:hypothetical protein
LSEFTVVGAVLMDQGKLVIRNAINDPNNVRSHYENWQAIWSSVTGGEGVIHYFSEPLPNLVLYRPTSSPLRFYLFV